MLFYFYDTFFLLNLFRINHGKIIAEVFTFGGELFPPGLWRGKKKKRAKRSELPPEKLVFPVLAAKISKKTSFIACGYANCFMYQS